MEVRYVGTHEKAEAKIAGQVLKYRIPQCREKAISQDLTLMYAIFFAISINFFCNHVIYKKVIQKIV